MQSEVIQLLIGAGSGLLMAIPIVVCIFCLLCYFCPEPQPEVLTDFSPPRDGRRKTLAGDRALSMSEVCRHNASPDKLKLSNTAELAIATQLSIADSQLSITPELSIADSQLSITGKLSITDSQLPITAELSIADSQLSITAELSIATQLSIADSQLSITPELSITDSQL
ncbi:hypothetical protein Bbelb_065950 [Branchiostoma belcheri]|nr:hypothetical protein Bbelb_065950 [Branchiostoma belcheri]